MQSIQGEKERISSRDADRACESGGTWSRRDFWLVAGIATVGAVARLCWVWAAISHFGVKKVYGGFEVAFVGASLANGHGFGSLFGDPSGPTATFAPLYPLLVGFAFRLFQVFSPSAAWFLFAINIACEVLILILLYWVGRRHFSPMVAFAASLFWAINFAVILYSVRIWYSSVSALLTMLALALYLHMRQVKPNRRMWVAYGVFWGVVALTNTAMIVMMPLAVVALFCRWGRAARRHALAALLVFGCTLVPWTVRNYIVFHKVIPIRGNLGAMLWYGNRPDVKSPHDEGMNPTQNLSERQEYLRLGDAEYAASRQRMAMHVIRQDPMRFVRLTWDRVQYFWAAAGLGADHMSLMAALWSLLAFAGLLKVLRQDWLLGMVLAGALVLYPLPYYVTLASTFFRYPIDPVVDLLAIYACAAVGSWFLLRLQTSRS